MMLRITMSWFYCWERKLEPTFKRVVKYFSAENVYKYLRRWHEGPAEVATITRAGCFLALAFGRGLVCQGERGDLEENWSSTRPTHRPTVSQYTAAPLSLLEEKNWIPENTIFIWYLVQDPSPKHCWRLAGIDPSCSVLADDDGIQRINNLHL